MTEVWFFIASPKSQNEVWENIEDPDWEKYKGHTAWGIPDGNEDIEKIERIEKGDIILCYNAAPKTAIVGQCKCIGRYNDDTNDGFKNGVCISDWKEYEKPIKFSDLRKKEFGFIKDFLGNNNGRRRSIVEVPKNDWDNFIKIYAANRRTIRGLNRKTIIRPIKSYISC